MTARVGFRTEQEDVELAAALAQRFGVGFDMSRVQRFAMRLGLTLLDLQPDLVMVAGQPAKKRSAAVKQRFAQEP